MEKTYPPLPRTTGELTLAEYAEQHKHSLADNDAFWYQQGMRLDWIRLYSQVSNVNWNLPGVAIRWYEDGTLNACVNCIDRHLAERGDQVAIIWEAEDPLRSKSLTFRQVHSEVCRLANKLLELGVAKGDTVTIYMPMIPEAAYAMLACARIGAVHSVVFGGFSAKALAERISDCQSRLVITADQGVRGGGIVPLKNNVDAAIELCGDVDNVLVVENTGNEVSWVEGRDQKWNRAIAEGYSADCEPAEMSAEDPLFILYTSGSTGKPKGVLHTTGGYLVYASYTHEQVFRCQPNERYWCTADVGWITGHSYIVYGPLANGITTTMFEGVPTYPDASRCWETIDRHAINVFYTAPTAIRALMRLGDSYLESTTRSSLRLLGSVGEPINPEAWEWYRTKVGQSRCEIVDTWWQTETGGILISPLPGTTPTKPGSATFPLNGVQPVLLEGQNELEGEAEGALCIKHSWPGQMRSLYGDHERFEQTYFSQYPGYYFSGDGARRDRDGYYWITGRLDDIINVSGHRMGTAEIESALVLHESVAEAAVVGYPHEIKGQGIIAFVATVAGTEAKPESENILRDHVGAVIGAIAKPDRIVIVPDLPKTRSGKIMRRILRKLGAGETSDFGDISTLANPELVEQLKQIFTAKTT